MMMTMMMMFIFLLAMKRFTKMGSNLLKLFRRISYDDDIDDIDCEKWTLSTIKRFKVRFTIVMEMTVESTVLITYLLRCHNRIYYDI